MALTLKVEQRLIDTELVTLYDDNEATWTLLAARTLNFVTENFPKDASVRRDDVAEALIPLLEVNETLKGHLAERSLRQKYWFRHFSDLILDRTWENLKNGG